MKKVTINIPCYNEEENIEPISRAVINEIEKINKYDYEIIFIDNCSTDNTRQILEKMCSENKKIKAIFNIKNFGQFNSPYYGMMQGTGDCSITMCCDFQDPVECIPMMLEKWEEGNKVICMVKTSSKENKIIRFFRTCYYKIIKKMSEGVNQIEHFTGFGLYDKSFIDVLRKINDPTPFLRGIIAEFAPSHLEIPYVQARRRAGKTHNNFFTLYDAAMLSFTSYTKIGLRIITLFGFFVSFVSFLVSIFYFVYKLIHWDTFNAGVAPLTIGVFLMGGIIIASLGFVGEYILSINQRVMGRPLVIEEKRINF